MFADILRKLRKSRKLNQKQFAKEVFISPSAVSQYETGRTMPSRETLDRIAKYFGVSTDFLLGVSPVAEFEELMIKEYCEGISVSDLLKMLMGLTGKNREILLHIIKALELQSNQEDLNEKLRRNV